MLWSTCHRTTRGAALGACSEKEYTARLVEFDKRCKELEAKTRAKLERKWLGPLCKPKLYRGQDGEAERESRTNRLFKGESTLQKEEVRRTTSVQLPH